MPVVVPTYQRGQGHQNRFRATAGLQAEKCPPVIDEVELHIAATTVELEIPLALTVGRIFMAIDDGQVGIQIAVSDRARQAKAISKPGGVVIIVKKPAHASRFVAVFDKEIFIAPLFKVGINVFSKWGAGRTRRAVPVLAVLFVAIIRRQVIATAKPPYGFGAFFFRNKKSNVGVTGGHVRIAGMNN